MGASAGDVNENYYDFVEALRERTKQDCVQPSLQLNVVVKNDCCPHCLIIERLGTHHRARITKSWAMMAPSEAANWVITNLIEPNPAVIQRMTIEP